MAGCKNKRAKSNKVTTSKTAKHDERIVSRINLPIVWKFRHLVMDEGKKWTWRTQSDDVLFEKVFSKLANFETMTYHELAQSSGSHAIEIDKFNQQVRKELERLEISDIAELFSIRLEGRIRVWCITSFNEFSLLWLDLNHEVYPCTR